MNEELEALSKIKSDHEIILFGFPTGDYEYAKEFDIIEKKLKILDFIAKEVLHVETREYHLSDGKSEYVLKYDIIYGRSITKEQFDLLKEAGI